VQAFGATEIIPAARFGMVTVGMGSEGAVYFASWVYIKIPCSTIKTGILHFQ